MSLWRGHSDNQKICRIARSILSSGFLRTETIVARAMGKGLEEGMFIAPCLMFGEGQARGLAAWLAWHVLEDVLSRGDVQVAESMGQVFKSLVNIPTHVDHAGAAYGADNVPIAQAVRPNT